MLFSRPNGVILGVFAYPRKKVQSGISSRLENDPLPILSIVTTTCMSMRRSLPVSWRIQVSVLERGEVEALQTDATSSVRQPRGVNVDEILRELAEIRIGTTGVI
jgi:hypothetical protein